MESIKSLKRQRYSCYSDIAQGIMLFIMFIAIQLAIYGIMPVPPVVVSIIPQAPIYSTLSPMTVGDLTIISIITAYGAIWGVRIIDSAIDKLRDIAEIESVESAATTS